jgi:Cdc6-like AAA superfamily ATPase
VQVARLRENQPDPSASKYERASFALKPSLPKGGVLACRDAEREKIGAHLRNGVAQGGSSQVLYVSGMPGTGKTAMVLEVLEQMRTNKLNFHLVHINAMRLSTPWCVFREISEQLPGASVNMSEARNRVTNFFHQRTEHDPVVVLLIDEIDFLKTANQSILYTVFDWLELPRARMVLASISNTMDLPERLLPRVASRFHIERVDFEPYNREQIHEILRSRLQAVGALDVFGDMVLRLCAARVAANSGDVRKALQVCRRAIQVNLNEPSLEPGPVKISHLSVAEKELLFASPVIQAVLNLSAQTRHFLAAAVLEFRLKEDAECISLPTVSARFQKILAMIAVDGERGAEGAGEAITDAESEEMAQQFTQRLEAMAIFAKTENSLAISADLQTISFGALDHEELASALLQNEEDPTIREILEAGSPDLMTKNIGKAIN